MFPKAAGEPRADRRRPAPRRGLGALRVLRDGARALLPALLGLLAVELLYAGFFGLDFLFGTDLRVFGVADAATERLVFTRYGRLLFFHQARILAFYLGIGLCVGVGTQALIALWEQSGVLRHRRHAHSAD